jgi:hypothetical protein
MLEKTNELTGAALDWAVAKCDGHKVFIKYAPVQVMYTPKRKRSWYIYSPSTNWAQNGPIIERELIEIVRGGVYAENFWKAIRKTSTAYGATPLIAAMRCYVTSKLGYEVDIPEELTNVRKDK